MLQEFYVFFMYLFRWRKGVGALMHVYVWEHIISLCYITTWWILILETWYGWRTQGPLHALRNFGQICPGADQGRGKNKLRGTFLKKTS